MKNQLLRSLVTTAALLTVVLASATTLRAQEGAAAEPLDPAEVQPEPRYVNIGQSREAVLSSMKGAPDEKLTPDIWLYWSFQRPDLPGRGRFDTLIVVFQGDRVRSYRLVEAKAARELLAQVKASRTDQQLARK